MKKRTKSVGQIGTGFRAVSSPRQVTKQNADRPMAVYNFRFNYRPIKLFDVHGFLLMVAFISRFYNLTKLLYKTRNEHNLKQVLTLIVIKPTA